MKKGAGRKEQRFVRAKEKLRETNKQARGEQEGRGKEGQPIAKKPAGAHPPKPTSAYPPMTAGASPPQRTPRRIPSKFRYALKPFGRCFRRGAI